MFLTILTPLPLVAPVNVAQKEVAEDGFLEMTVTALVKKAVQSPVIPGFPHDGIQSASSHATTPWECNTQTRQSAADPYLERLRLGAQRVSSLFAEPIYVPDRVTFLRRLHLALSTN